jgi:aldehyde dehydrogenase (NAD+)
VLAEESIREELLGYIKQEITKQFGEHPLDNPDYGKMVNQKHFDRVLSLIDQEKLVFGGESRKETLQIAPTVLDGVKETDAVMQEEIFGPLLPVLSVKNMDEAYAFVKHREKPLALYLFTSEKATEKRFLREVSYGGGCVNDTIIHLATSDMGFGGVGNSGMGSYHGKKSFETFSHEKSIVKKYTWLDLPMRYQPYTKMKEKLVRMFVR